MATATLTLVHTQVPVLDRGGFFADAELELAYARAERAPALAVVADLSSLDELSGGLSDAAGAEAINSAAEPLREVLGQRAVIGMIGNEGFAALVCSNRLTRGTIEMVELEIEWARDACASAALDVGAIEIPASDRRSLDELLTEADARLCADRHAGMQGRQRFREVGRPGRR